MGSQNEHRSGLNIFELKNGIIKFYPIIDVTEEKANDYIRVNHLPVHPLVTQGYHSVGCVHCTVAGRSREGRWINKSKTECGLHL
jgi:phosphoadenosine phosphosulfate reductase